MPYLPNVNASIFFGIEASTRKREQWEEGRSSEGRSTRLCKTMSSGRSSEGVLLSSAIHAALDSVGTQQMTQEALILIISRQRSSTRELAHCQSDAEAGSLVKEYLAGEDSSQTFFDMSALAKLGTR